MTMSSIFDVPMHNKSLCLRDMAILREPAARTHTDGRDNTHSSANKDSALVDPSRWPSQAFVLLAVLVTGVYYLRHTKRFPATLADTFHFYTLAVLPMLLYSRVQTAGVPTWHLHAAGMLFAYERDGETVSAALFVTVLALTVTAIFTHHRPQQTTYVLLAGCFVLNSVFAIVVCLMHDDVVSRFYFNFSYIAVFLFMLFI
jgi:membrane-associated HD superfamily phosphohydrolase